MSVSITSVIKNRGKFVGGLKAVIADLSLSGTYATGGASLTAAHFGLGSLQDVIMLDGAVSIGAPSWVRSTRKLQLFKPGSTSGVVMDIFAPLMAAKVAADDVAGTAAYSDVTGGSSLLGANFAAIAASAADVAATPIALANSGLMDVPRNVVVCVHNINAGTVACGACSFVIVGTFNGGAQTETITFGSVSHANGKASYKNGAKPFDSITSITPSATSVTGYQTTVGIGGLLGLSQPLLTPAETDAIQVTRAAAGAAAAPIAISSIISATNNTVKIAAIAAGDSVMVKYLAGAFAEFGSGVSVGTPTIRVMGLGV